MRHRVGHSLRTLGVMAAVAVAGLVGTVVVQTPAQAVEPPPGCELVKGYSAAAGGGISAWRYWDCGTYEELFPVSIQRYQSPGVYLTVASGTGDAYYACTGSAYNVYRIPGTAEFPILCS